MTMAMVGDGPSHPSTPKTPSPPYSLAAVKTYKTLNNIKHKTVTAHPTRAPTI